jgi:hypothetical protein
MSFNGALTPDLMRITGDVSATQTFWFDGVMTGQFQFDLTSAPALEVTETHLPDAEVGSFYSAPELLQAQGGIPPYIWSVAPGSPLPPGLVLSHSNSRGTLGGILDATAEEDSRYDPLLRRFLFRVEVSDAYGHTAQSEIALEVECGDERDDLIEEYQLYGVFDESKQELFVPRCVEITSTGRTQFYSFQELNVSNTSFPGMALLKNSLLTGEGVPLVFKSVGLDGIVANYGSIPVHAPPCPAPGLPSCVVNSGYRTPEQQADVSPAYPNGRHIFGDAVDLPNPDRNSPLEVKKATYDRLVNAALSAGADWVENVAAKIDCAPSVMNCVHADYRNTKAKYAK